MPVELLAQADLGAVFTLQGAYVIAALVLIEGLLSVDNALAIAAMAAHLDEKKRKLAVTIGFAGAYGFRIVALLLVVYIIKSPFLMALGAGYLIWLMCNHFAENEDEEEHKGTGPMQSFAKTISMIALLDLSLSFDNVVAAVAFARNNYYLVCIGVTIGMLTLFFVAGYCIKLLAKHPWLEHTAFLLVGFVGALLCVELYWDQVVRQEFHPFNLTIIHAEGGNFHIQKSVKFGGIFLIIIGHLIYEKTPLVRTVFRPMAILVRHIFALFARTINLVVGLIIWPIQLLFSLSRRTN